MTKPSKPQKRKTKKKAEGPTELEKLQALAAAHGFKLERPKETRIGPPIKYDAAFHPDSYIDLAAQGKTKAQICATWNIHRDTLREWSQTPAYPELSAAIKRGDDLRSQWWTNFGLSIAAGKMKGSNATMAIFLMKNIVPNDFRDRIDHTHTLDVEDMDFGD